MRKFPWYRQWLPHRHRPSPAAAPTSYPVCGKCGVPL